MDKLETVEDLKIIKTKSWTKQDFEFWEHGQKTQLADILGIRPQYLHAILNRYVGLSKYRAKKFEAASRLVLGKCIPWEAWLLNESTRHPAFRADNRQNEKDLIRCS